jgi:HD-like signal output (HDOD) protein
MTATEETLNRDAFAFVQKLAQELSGGQVQLPSYPEVAMRVQRALANENSSLNTVVRAVVVEPALSMQVMRMANSAALNSSGQQVHDLNAAVQRIGYSMVRAAALSFVMQQLRSAEGLKPLRQRLNELWRRGVVVGTVSRTVARHTRTVTPDAALLVGLLHGVGKLYILTRLQNLPHLLEQGGGAEKIIAEWHGNVARALLENWEMPEEFGNAVAEFEDSEREFRGGVNLTDVLAVADVLADLVPDDAAAKINESRLADSFVRYGRLFHRLGVDQARCAEILAVASPEAGQMKALFGA